jgi:iron complex outermembrane receptor protein
MEMSLSQLLEVEITSASKLEVKIREAPSTANLITKQQIEAYGWRTLNDILYKLPGFGPGQDYDRRTVPARGLFDSWSNNHLLHLVDGVPMNDNLYGTAYTWDNTPIFWVKNVEVIRGPGSALYGSNATNGVIGVNTLSPEDLEEPVYARFETGDLQTQRFDALLGRESSWVNAMFAFSYYETDGNLYNSLDGSARSDAAGNLASFETDDRRRSDYVWTKLTFHNMLEGLEFQYHRQGWNFQTGHGWLFWIPDFEELMEENRNIFSLSYTPTLSSTNIEQEYVLRYQDHQLTWNQRYYPDDAFAGFYPSGMWEYLDTDAQDIFARVQLGYSLEQYGHILGGLEATRFSYDGDNEHFSNINVDADGAPPFPGDRNNTLGPWLDYILDQPILTTGLYAQYSSRDLFEKMKITAGVRWDRQEVDYENINEVGRPAATKTSERISPRLALVYLANEELSLKFMGGKAFRAPMPTELAGAHTFSLASNIEDLEPELITTIEVMADWQVNRYLNLRGNLFETEFENQIAFSTANNNLSTNVFSQTTRGLEIEALFGFGKFTGFFNASFADRVEETVLDTTIAEDDDNITWEPEEKFNFGVNYVSGRWQISLSGHHHGSVQRRPSDLGVQELPFGVGVSLDMDQYRPRQLNSWFTLDGKAHFQVTSAIGFSIFGTNLLDEEDTVLVKTGPFPFDYQQEGRRVNVSLQLKL